MSAARFTELKVIDTLLIQGVTIPCYRCREPITRDDIQRKNCQREHLHETGLGGPNVPDNCRYSHRDQPCHARITDGSPATTAGSSKHRIAKANRIELRTNAHVPGYGFSPVKGTERCGNCGEYRDTCRCLVRVKRKAQINGAGFQKVHQPMRRAKFDNTKDVNT